MRLRFVSLGLEVHLTVNRVKKATGITSITKDGYSVFFWDFDDVKSSEDVVLALRDIQDRYYLSTIYLYTSSSSKYHAICLSKEPDFFDAWNIVRETPGVDIGFLQMSALRRRFTLRYSDIAMDDFVTIEPIREPFEGISSFYDLKDSVIYHRRLK